MRLILFLLFVAMPFVEIALLIQLGSALGFWPTIAIVVITALVGANVLRAQGIATMHRISQSIASGEPPIKPVVDGFFLAISGAFLITPGVVTDAVGLLLLIPPVRHAIARWGLGHMIKKGNFTIFTQTASHTTNQAPNPPPGDSSGGSDRGPPNRSRPASGNAGPIIEGSVIDGEFEEVKKN